MSSLEHVLKQIAYVALVVVGYFFLVAAVILFLASP